MENLIKKIEELRERIIKTRQLLAIDVKKNKIKELERQVNRPDFWNNQEKAVGLSKDYEDLNAEVGEWETILNNVRELEEITAIANKDNDDSISGEIEEKYRQYAKEFERLEFYLLFSEDYDRNDAVISVHAGTGGVDAQDWAEILERMFLRFAEKKNYKTEILDRNTGNEAGIKSSVIKISGAWAYGNLKSESGVHRLVRISPFDAEGMRHTSFALVEVIPELPADDAIEIKDEDIKIDVFRSSGPGGQSVNTTDSAVRITHEPTGTIVKCQNERSQHQNKEKAMTLLKSKLFKLQLEERQKEERKLKGENQMAEWGKQIRSYVMQPYKLAKDHRTEYEETDVDKVLEGNLDGFIEAYLRHLTRNT